MPRLEGRPQGLSKSIDILGCKEGSVTTHPAGIINEGNQPGAHGDSANAHMRAVERVGLPHFIGMGFGKGEAHFVGRLTIRQEELVLVDKAPEGVRCNLETREVTGFNAKPVEHDSRKGSVP